jgi:phage terminase Nu1 subunit (DNA packaging protein)
MRHVLHRPYVDAMTEERRDSLIRHPSVTIAAAAELTDVDVPTVRGWARSGSIVIEQRGDMEVVQLDEVRALAVRRRTSGNRAIRDRLRGADEGAAPLAEVVNIADLQELVREREK